MGHASKTGLNRFRPTQLFRVPIESGWDRGFSILFSGIFFPALLAVYSVGRFLVSFDLRSFGLRGVAEAGERDVADTCSLTLEKNISALLFGGTALLIERYSFFYVKENNTFPALWKRQTFLFISAAPLSTRLPPPPLRRSRNSQYLHDLEEWKYLDFPQRPKFQFQYASLFRLRFYTCRSEWHA